MEVIKRIFDIDVNLLKKYVQLNALNTWLGIFW